MAENVSGCFRVNKGLQQESGMSPWLSDTCTEEVVGEIFKRTQGRCTRMIEPDQRRWLLNELLFPDDTALVDESAEQLRY